MTSCKLGSLLVLLSHEVSNFFPGTKTPYLRLRGDD